MPKLCDQGEHAVLEVFMGGATRGGSGDLYLGLYTDTTEPGEATTLSTITELAVTHGYARIALADGDWTIVADLATNLQKTFTASGGDWGNIYGYFICDVSSGTSGNLLFVEQFSDGPYNITDGLSVKITPSILAA